MTGRFRPEQMVLGEVSSEDIYINPGSRDDIPKILRGIRSLVSNREFRAQLEMPMEAGFLPGSAGEQGRPGIGPAARGKEDDERGATGWASRGHSA